MSLSLSRVESTIRKASLSIPQVNNSRVPCTRTQPATISCAIILALTSAPAMQQAEALSGQAAFDTERGFSPYVPSLERTQGQPPPIAANGGLSYASFERNGDAGTLAATKAALEQIAEGKGQEVIDLLENAPPGPIQTKWGIGFLRYSECMEYIREQKMEAPEGGVVLPLRYTVHEQPSYTVVPSNALWRDPARGAEAKALRKEDHDTARRCLYFPQVLRDARRIQEYYPGLSPYSVRMHG